MKAIAQSGIKRIIYLSDKYADIDTTKAAKRICDALGIRYEQFKGEVYIRD
jgi:dCMP deaminase